MGQSSLWYHHHSGTVCTIVDIVKVFMLCQFCTVVPHALSHSVFKTGLDGRSYYCAHFVQGEKEAGTAAGWAAEAAGVLCADGIRGEVLSLTANWVFLFRDWSFISFHF